MWVMKVKDTGSLILKRKATGCYRKLISLPDCTGSPLRTLHIEGFVYISTRLHGVTPPNTTYWRIRVYLYQTARGHPSEHYILKDSCISYQTSRGHPSEHYILKDSCISLPDCTGSPLRTLYIEGFLYISTKLHGVTPRKTTYWRILVYLYQTARGHPSEDYILKDSCISWTPEEGAERISIKFIHQQMHSLLN